MIQRIQSLLLLLAVIINLLVLFVPSWKYQSVDNTERITGMKIVVEVNADETTGAVSNFYELGNTEKRQWIHLVFFVFILSASAFLLLVIFMFNNRPKQMRMAFVGIALLMLETVALVLMTQWGPYIIAQTNDEGSFQFGMALPLIAILLVWLASKRIKADDDLVRSVDRIR